MPTDDFHLDRLLPSELLDSKFLIHSSTFISWHSMLREVFLFSTTYLFMYLYQCTLVNFCFSQWSFILVLKSSLVWPMWAPQAALVFFNMFPPFSEDFPQSSVGEESACSAGDLGSVLGSGRSSGGGNATHSSILAWKIPWTEEPSRLQSTGS